MAYHASSSSFEFEDLVPNATGVTTLLNNTDDGTGTIDLVALPGDDDTFSYFGQDYNSVFVSANGLVTLVTGSTDPNNGDLTTTPPQRTIAALWDDWDTSGGSGATDSTVLYKYSPEHGGELIIEWSNVTHVNVGGSNGVTFQAILDLDDSGGSNGEMRFQYADLTVGNANFDNGASATVGIKNVGIASGDNRLLVFQNGGGPQASLVGVNKCLEIEDSNAVPVLLNSTTLAYLTSPHTLTLVFDQAVTGLDATDLVVAPVGGGSTFTPASVSGSGTNTAVFTFAGAIPDGRFTGTIAAGAINGTGGNPSSQTITTAEFFFLRGDANHDGQVNLQDFNVLASNFGQSGRDFSQGDFNYDGTVNLADFNLLASRFGTSVAPAASATAGSTTVTNTVKRTADDCDDYLLA